MDKIIKNTSWSNLSYNQVQKELSSLRANSYKESKPTTPKEYEQSQDSDGEMN